mgnify:CR=1 FL=1
MPLIGQYAGDVIKSKNDDKRLCSRTSDDSNAYNRVI